MNDLVKQQGNTGVATQGNANTAVNYYQQYGDQMSARTIRGKLLKFSKGDYLAGEDNDDVPSGTRFIAKMDDLMIGWQCWKDQKPVDHVMGRLGEGYQPPRRDTLGDDDQSQWEHDPASGELRDPWQFSNMIPFRLISKDGQVEEGDDDESRGVHTFTTSSKGGLGSLGLLTQKFGKAMRQHEGQYPIIEIGVDSYPHKNKAFGRIKFPTFKIVGWVPMSMFSLDDDEPELPIDEPQQKTRI